MRKYKSLCNFPVVMGRKTLKIKIKIQKDPFYKNEKKIPYKRQQILYDILSFIYVIKLKGACLSMPALC